MGCDGGEQRVEVVANGSDLEVVLRLEQPSKAFADEVLVLGEHNPDRHREEDTTAVEQPLVLIVDDNERNRGLARDVLRAAGLRTIEAARGRECIASALEHRPDVILLDLRLPDMDGTEVARELRNSPEASEIPVVALTAVLADGGWLSLAGFAGYIEKPIDVREFPERVLHYCAESPPEGST
jgi:two-component system cell cycle response regulator DivK